MFTPEQLLIKGLKELETSSDAELKKLNELAAKVVEDYLRSKEELIISYGYKKCKECQGTGALEKLDSGYMRRFGLREWDGCEVCGGDRKTKGKGFIKES